MKDEAVEVLKELWRYEHTKFSDKYIREALEMAIKALEEQKVGRWLGHELGECSVCGHEGCASDIWDGCEHKYCPNCGCRMIEPIGK